MQPVPQIITYVAVDGGEQSGVTSIQHSVIEKGEHEKYLFLLLHGNRENSVVTASAPGSQK